MAERRMTIHFSDGTRLSFTFPQQAADGYSVSSRVEEALRAQYLLVECEGSMMMFPFASIKYVQVHPAPSPVPPNAVHGAKLVD
jgi:hypothetical protein